MKKLLVIFLLVIPLVFGFSQTKRGNVGVGFGYNTIIESSTVSGVKFKTYVPSIAANLAASFLKNDKIGIGLYGSVLLPRYFKISALGSSIKVDNSAYDFLLGLDFLIGPTFYIVNKPKFRLPLSFGIHSYSLWSSVKPIDNFLTEVGTGLNISTEFNLFSNFLIYLRVQANYDIFAWGREKNSGVKTTDMGFTRVFGIHPSAGIAIRF